MVTTETPPHREPSPAADADVFTASCITEAAHLIALSFQHRCVVSHHCLISSNSPLKP